MAIFLTIFWISTVIIGVLTESCLQVDTFGNEYQCQSKNTGILNFQLKTNKIFVNCINTAVLEGAQFNTVTFSGIKEVQLMNCPFPLISFQEVFEHFGIRHVKILDFSSYEKGQRVLNATVFKGLSQLEVLIVASTGLEIIHGDIFVNLPKLVQLEIRHNSLQIRNYVLENGTNLKFLDFSQNFIGGLPADFFRNLWNLEVLNLWGNHLYRLQKGLFTGLVEVKFLDLSENSLQIIDQEAFADLTNLEILDLSRNNLTYLSPIFTDNSKLRDIILKYNNLTLMGSVLGNLESLKFVDLTHANLHVLPENLFQNSSQITKISLSKNHLRALPLGLFSGLNKLRSIRLDQNKLTMLDQGIFGDCIHLSKLYLQENHLTGIDKHVFNPDSKLKIINLSHNKLENVSVLHHILHFFTLEVLDLSHNFLESIGELSFYTNPKLRVLNFSHNVIKKIARLEAVSEILLYLQSNQIKYLENIHLHKFKVFLENNPLSCDCRNFKFFQNLTGSKNIFLKNISCNGTVVQVKNINLEVFKCPVKQCPIKCFCFLTPFWNSFDVNCTGSNYDSFPKIAGRPRGGFNQTRLFLDFNNLTRVDKEAEVFDNVTVLSLSQNQVREITWLPPQLEVLNLNNNNLTSLSGQVIKIFKNSNLRNLSLSGNKWVCDCEIAPLANFLHKNLKKLNSEIYCEGSLDLIAELSIFRLCYTYVAFVLFAVMFLLLCVTIGTVLFFHHQHSIKTWLYIHKLCSFWINEAELDLKKNFDVFISYSHQDQEFVENILVKNLDKDYEVCIHTRDFVAGESISAQITEAIIESKRTLVVLSSSFMKSVWGRVEFKTAHAQAMLEKRNKIIVIMYEKISIDELDPDLRLYIKTNTYIQWGDHLFWAKLKYALPHKQPNSTNDNSISRPCCIRRT